MKPIAIGDKVSVVGVVVGVIQDENGYVYKVQTKSDSWSYHSVLVKATEITQIWGGE